MCVLSRILVVLIICVTASAHAERVYASEIKPKVPVEIDSSFGEEKSNFHIATGAYISSGNIGTKNGTIASRTVNSATAYLQLGHESGYITPFVIGEYGAAVQSTDSSRVSGTNMGGTGYDVGFGLRFVASKVNFTASYLPFGNFELSSKTASGSLVSYSDPTIWMLSLGYSLDSFSLFVVQKFVEFSKSTTGSVSTSMGDDRLSHVSTGGGVEWKF